MLLWELLWSILCFIDTKVAPRALCKRRRTGLALSQRKSHEPHDRGLEPPEAIQRCPSAAIFKSSAVLELVGVTVAQFLDLHSLGELIASEASLWDNVWGSIGFWEDRVTLAGMESVMKTKGFDVTSVRDAFRHTTFGLSGAGTRLRSLGRDQGTVLREAARMLLGFLPHDGAEFVEEVVDLAERALNGLDPGCAMSLEAAEALLAAAERSVDVVGERQLERLEHAFRSSQNLHDLMTSSILSHLTHTLHDLQESFWTEAEKHPEPFEDADADFNWLAFPELDGCDHHDVDGNRTGVEMAKE